MTVLSDGAALWPGTTLLPAAFTVKLSNLPTTRPVTTGEVVVGLGRIIAL